MKGVLCVNSVVFLSWSMYAVEQNMLTQRACGRCMFLFGINVNCQERQLFRVFLILLVTFFLNILVYISLYIYIQRFFKGRISIFLSAVLQHSSECPRV